MKLITVLFFSCLAFLLNAQVKADSSLNKQVNIPHGGSYFRKANHQNIKVDSVKRNEWMDACIDSLITSLDTLKWSVSESILIKQNEGQFLVYRILSNGIIESMQEKIFIFLHSSHKSPVIGDVILAISDSCEVFINYGHVCGNMVEFESDDSAKPINLNDFIKRFKPELTESPWVKWMN